MGGEESNKRRDIMGLTVSSVVPCFPAKGIWVRASRWGKCGSPTQLQSVFGRYVRCIIVCDLLLCRGALPMSRPRKVSRCLPDMLAELVMASGLGYLASAYTASRWLTKPTPRRLVKTPFDYNLFYENAECVTSDGEHLAGWVISPARPIGTLILCHGVRHNREQLLGRIALFAKHGYRCVAFDHRAHGESTGKRTTFGYLESRDVAAIVELARQRWPDQPRAALGVSMGAAALCYAAECTRRLQALVLESVYHDIRSAFFTRMAAYPSYIRTLDQAILWVTERRLGLRLAQLCPVEYVGTLGSAPVLLLTGAQDLHATPEDTYQLYERCRGPREILVIPNAAHGDVFETGGRLYEERVLGFLERHACFSHNSAA